MIEIIAWGVSAAIGLAVAIWTIIWLAPARRSKREAVRIVARGHTLKMALASTAHLGTMWVAWQSIDLALDSPKGWNWSLTTDATARGSALVYLLLWVQVVLMLNSVILRVTWNRAERAEG